MKMLRRVPQMLRFAARFWNHVVFVSLGLAHYACKVSAGACYVTKCVGSLGWWRGAFDVYRSNQNARAIIVQQLLCRATYGFLNRDLLRRQHRVHIA